MTGSAGVGAERGELVITRWFDAPRELVFAAWTEPERLQRWWGPSGTTLVFNELDLRVGGVWRYCMRIPDMPDHWIKGEYREIVRPERIVCTLGFTDADGEPVAPEHYGLSPDTAQPTLVTVTFEERDGGTEVTMRQYLGFLPPSEREGANKGWSQSFDRLVEYLRDA